jgi:hypothetical protein
MARSTDGRSATTLRTVSNSAPNWKATEAAIAASAAIPPMAEVAIGSQRPRGASAAFVNSSVKKGQQQRRSRHEVAIWGIPVSIALVFSALWSGKSVEGSRLARFKVHHRIPFLDRLYRDRDQARVERSLSGRANGAARSPSGGTKRRARSL